MHARILNLAAAAVFVGVLMAASAASAAPVGAMAIGDGAAAVGLIDHVQRCRCVEQRWNGSCKRRICKERWEANVDSAEPADTVAPSSDAEEQPEDRSMNAPDQEGQRKTKSVKPR